jgi:hypothetical protein
LQAHPALAVYFASDFNTKMFQNNGLFAFYDGNPSSATYGASTTTKVTF